MNFKYDDKESKIYINQNKVASSQTTIRVSIGNSSKSTPKYHMSDAIVAPNSTGQISGLVVSS